jgi:nucleotide-binding universal stress UspA family protein
MSNGTFRRILVACDGSEPALRAFAKAVLLAKAMGAELHVISVAEDLPRFAGTVGEMEDYKHRAEREFQKLDKQLQSKAAEDGIPLRTHILYGHEVETIVAFARKHRCDILVIGFVGYSGVLRKMVGNWGSTAQSLTRLAPCTVLVVK